VGLGATLRRETGGLVEHQRARVAVEYHRRCERDVGIGERTSLACGARSGGSWRDWHRDALPCLDPIRHIGFAPIEGQLARPCPARDQRVRRTRPVALEPAVEADAVILVGNDRAVAILGRGAHAGSSRMTSIPRPQAEMPTMTEDKT